MKHLPATTTLTATRLTFTERLAALQQVNAAAHHAATLAARTAFDERLLALVNVRAHQMLDAIVAD